MHRHTPIDAQLRGAQFLTKCQECGGKICRPLLQPEAEWREVVMKERYALILITAELDYLTADGEESEESGWEAVAESLTTYMSRFQKFNNSEEPIAQFIEWEESDGA